MTDRTSVVDIHMKKGIIPEFDEYIGREVRDYRTGAVRYHQSKWHNPHLPLERTPETLTGTYEEYIRAKIEENSQYYNLDELKDKRLGDWCITTSEIEPLVCHGQILMKLIRERRSAHD